MKAGLCVCTILSFSSSVEHLCTSFNIRSSHSAEGRAASYGATGISHILQGHPSTPMEPAFQLQSTLWLFCKQPGVSRTRCWGETCHIAQARLCHYVCALLRQLAQLHGAVHNSRLDDFFVDTHYLLLPVGQGLHWMVFLALQASLQIFKYSLI